MTSGLTPLALEFLLPGRLWWLLVVPGIALLYFALATRRSRFTGPSVKSRLDLVIPKDKAWKRHLAVGAACLAIVALVIAYAKPKSEVQVPRDRATIVVAIDVSRSMAAQDVKPDRLKAAQAAAKDFLGMLPERFNVALVAFAGTADLLVPPTTDRGSVARAIDNLKLAPSTAIGDGVYESLDALKLVPPDPKNPKQTAPAAIVLLSDGATNIGKPSLGAAREAKKQGVPVYTIAYGTASGYVVENGVRQPVPVNHAELSQVAKESGGKKFSAASASELKSVYEAIAKSVGYETQYKEITDRFVGYALVLAALAALSVMSLAARWP